MVTMQSGSFSLEYVRNRKSKKKHKPKNESERKRESKSQRASMNSSEKWFPIKNHFLAGDIRLTTDLNTFKCITIGKIIN